MLPIWEGTTNILSLNVLRVLQKSRTEVFKAPDYFDSLHHCSHDLTVLQALTCFADAVRSKMSDIRGLEAAGLSSHAEQVKVQLDSISSFCLKLVQEDPSMLECAARDFAFSLAQIYISELFYKASKLDPFLLTNLWCNYKQLAIARKDY